MNNMDGIFIAGNVSFYSKNIGSENKFVNKLQIRFRLLDVVSKFWG